ncbi:MAG: hypothetical protein M1837_001862 [Sclerophora amabilis]|nr:MAG: hypothetical protein M1837_001862 [Sclerophora amabilis]
MTVAHLSTLSELLTNLTRSLASAVNSVPEADQIIPPQDGISLLDTKNELLLSYLQNLVFLIIIKLRNASSSTPTSDETKDEGDQSDEEVVKKLVELRVYLERGVRPLEGRLKYQIDKVLRAAGDEAIITNGPYGGTGGDRAGQSGPNAASDTQNSGSEDAATGSEEDADGVTISNGATAEIDELSYRPNPASLLRPSQPSSRPAADAAKDGGFYRPPRITPTALPATSAGRDDRNGAARRPGKAATLDEFISSEMSTAPLAEPSVGSTITSGGRRSQTQRERELHSQRRDYEENNFVRLPKESKKERAKKGGRREAGYGGEDWRGLGEGLSRIERLTSRGKGGTSRGRDLLEKSRKRSAADQDRPRGQGGPEIGERFEKRRKMLGQRNRRGGG